MPDTIVTSLKLLIARLCSKTTKCKICGVIKKGPFFLRLHYKIMHKKEMLNDLLRIGTPINIGMFFLYILYSSQCLLMSTEGIPMCFQRPVKGSQGLSRALKGTAIICFQHLFIETFNGHCYQMEIGSLSKSCVRKSNSFFSIAQWFEPHS